MGNPLKKLNPEYCAEFIGTFCLVFAGTGAIMADAVTGGVIGHTGIAITFGLIVMVMVHTLGDISGAHINPAVTIGFWVAGRFPIKKVFPFIFAQLLGATAASSALCGLLDGANGVNGITSPSDGIIQSFLFEVLLTFILMYVILAVSTGAKEKGLLAGLSIGGTVLLAALFAGPISGASMNPARSFGPAVIGKDLSSLWIYVLAPILGAIIATFICKLTSCCLTEK